MTNTRTKQDNDITLYSIGDLKAMKNRHENKNDNSYNPFTLDEVQKELNKRGSLNSVDVIFADSKYNYSTNVSSSATAESCKVYFVGKSFDLGIFPIENMQRCINIKFTDNNI